MLPTSICLHLSYFSCFDIVACSALCAEWLQMLEYRHIWMQYCVDLELPLPLWSLHELRRYVAALVTMDRCWLKYKVHDRARWKNGFRVFDTRVLGTTILPCVDEPWRHRGKGLSPVLRKVLTDLSNTLRALPYDYVAALESIWQPDGTYTLGDIRLIHEGVPVARDVCKDPVTNLSAVCIGYHLGGHLFGDDFNVHELIMSFQARTCDYTGMCAADVVSYHVVCHNRLGHQSPGPFGFANAAAAILGLRTSVQDLMEINEFCSTGAVYSHASYADLIASCVESIARARQGLRGGCFTPCLQYWLEQQR